MKEVETGEKLSDPISIAVGDAGPSKPRDKKVEGSRSSASKGPSSGKEHTDLVYLCKRIQELHAENDDLLSCRAAGKKIQMDRLVKRCSEKNKSSLIELEMKKLTKLLAKSWTER